MPTQPYRTCTICLGRGTVDSSTDPNIIIPCPICHGKKKVKDTSGRY